MKYSTIILGAGLSTRFGENKLYYKLKDKEIILYSVDLFSADNDCQEIILVVNQKDISKTKNILSNYNKVKIVIGGDYRHDSFVKGYSNLKCNSDYILVHDAARPFLSLQLLENIKKSFMFDYDAIIPCLSIADSLINIVDNNVNYLNRDNVKIIQTPQVFKKNIIDPIFIENNYSYFNDEFSWLLSFNQKISYTLIEGEKENRKITFAKDLY